MKMGTYESRYEELNVDALQETAGKEGDSCEGENGDVDHLKNDSDEELCLLQQL